MKVKNFTLTNHALERMGERGIKKKDVEKCLLIGKSRYLRHKKCWMYFIKEIYLIIDLDSRCVLTVSKISEAKYNIMDNWKITT